MDASRKPIPSAPAYSVDAEGRIWGPRGGTLRPYLGVHGYPIVSLTTLTGKRSRSVHVMVAEAWLGPRPDGKEVNHIDGVKTNSAPGNLEYVTHSENVRHAICAGLGYLGDMNSNAKLTDKQIAEVVSSVREGERAQSVAARFGITYGYALRLSKGQKRAERVCAP